MKAESTIRRQMKELFKYSDDNSAMIEDQRQAYCMATALQWVLEDCSWNPVSLVKKK